MPYGGSSTIVLIEGEPFLSRAIEYRDKLEECRLAWREFALARGATGVPGSLTGLNFSGVKSPAGWTKPGRHGFSSPKKGHEDEAAIKALPRKPPSSNVFGDTLIETISWEGPGDRRGFSSIGFFMEGPSIGWAGDTYFAVIPDPRKAVKDFPLATILNGADKWQIPAGLKEITEAERDLIVAQFKVDQQKATQS